MDRGGRGGGQCPRAARGQRRARVQIVRAASRDAVDSGQGSGGVLGSCTKSVPCKGVDSISGVRGLSMNYGKEKGGVEGAVHPGCAGVRLKTVRAASRVSTMDEVAGGGGGWCP